MNLPCVESTNLEICACAPDDGILELVSCRDTARMMALLASISGLEEELY